MDVVVKGRHQAVSDSFQAHATEKVSKVEQLSPRAQAVEVQLRHENTKNREEEQRVEITIFQKGPVLRAEAAADDKYAALDLAWAKLLERLRRTKDRNKVARSGHRRKSSTGEALAAMPVIDPLVPQEGVIPEPDDSAKEAPDASDQTNGRIRAEGDSPVILREKRFPAQPIGIEEALNRMEMVGHDFYLFIDEENEQPSVVYRRKGWSYGVIALDETMARDSAEVPS
ncbi:ribosome hibernation-promoting factor, HPF/YfiA family [Brevibacterium jeotgali]|uniref:Ribosome hibernation promoting factor n=1 Tax=Brevibacterium jeotgali TaxID=1262550 RepID=A0A2H1L641_9MICO|nr:ribosome-associated translation inhibitor RaiA [Brevibacterium jeotgali]TWC03554.1 ribosomal subunit interface protein [Brevibacterium jeotgali]SMY12377.1 ribosomal subunit interface protein [Brevibacterium jeotgali]